MKKIFLQKVNLDKKKFLKRGALENDGKISVEEECIAFDKDTGEYLFGLFRVDRDPTELIKALNNIHFLKVKRTNGLTSTSRIFGYSPRIKMRNDYCNKTMLQTENKEAHDIITSYATEIEKVYTKYAEEAYNQHKEKSNNVLDQWRINGTVFTSGIVNKNNPLNYHYDAGNFEGCYSCMITIKEGIQGGYLMIPEYDCQIKTFSNSLFMFDGQKILHGVSPIIKSKNINYRYTIVYYSLKSMRQCLSLDEEFERIKKEKTELYKKRKVILVDKQKEDENTNT